jgi:2-polyprenyl-6-methoxyphenol hydroxylase-like FAD-dependent oxidoreductase
VELAVERRILIAGGGIGGLSAALALSRIGVSSLVLERASRFAEIGAGIQLAPNAFHAFDALGVGDAARAMAVFVDRLQLMDALTADPVAHVDLGAPFRRHYGNPYAVVHRGDLYGVLLRACRESGRVELQTDADVTAYQQDGASVEATLASGATLRGAALIGADGLWSNVRRQLVGDGPPVVSGHTSFRAVIPTAQMPEELRWNAATLWAGPRCHLVHYPLSDWKVFNLVATCHDYATEPVAGVPVEHDEVLRGFRHLHPRAMSLIQRGTAWRKWVLCDREPVERWVDGRVALLGDAAHPMLQYLAQGACMALEDAVVLADAIAHSDAIETALQVYCRRRVLRTARVQLQSRAIGEHIYHPAGVHAALRNSIMRAKSQEDWYAVLDWIYDPTDVTRQS